MIRDYERRFNLIAILGLVFGFALLATVVATAFFTYNSNQQSSARVEHTHRVISLVSQVDLLLERAETSSRGYILARDQARLKTFDDNIAQIEPTLVELEAAIADNPSQVARVAELRMRTEAEIGAANAIMDLAKAGRIAEATALFKRDAPLRRVIEIRRVVGEVMAAESGLLTQRRQAEKRTANVLKWVLGGAAFLMIAVGLFTFLLARRYTHQLGEARDRLHVLNTDLEGEVQRRTADLQRANDEIQRFAYIVSHDLRSPLVNILGFTAELETTNKTLGGLIERAEKSDPDLVTEDVRHAQQDLPEAIGFIRTSTQKMDRLINAILKLSREGRRSLTPELLPMKQVLDEIAASLDQRIVDAEASVEISEWLPDMTSDRVAIEQIFSNLIENALKYSEPGRTTVVKVRGKLEGQRIIYEVQDNGRGIDPKDHSRIFDLFRRSGVQDKAGEGIGLAQVRALVNRLGGFIDVKSELGQGALFRLSFPKTYIDQGEADE